MTDRGQFMTHWPPQGSPLSGCTDEARLIPWVKELRQQVAELQHRVAELEASAEKPNDAG